MAIPANKQQAASPWGAEAHYIVYGPEGGPFTIVDTPTPLPVTVVSGGGSGSNAAAGATGSAVPAQADYQGVNVGGTLRGQTAVNPSGSIYAAQVDLASIAGTTADTNSGNKSAGTLRIVIATDQPVLNNAFSVTPSPATSGGLSKARIKSASGTNATSVKGSAGQLYGWFLYNNTSSVKALHLYDTASTPTAGSGTPAFTVPIPANGGANVEFSMGIPFASGIGYTITTGVGDSDTGSCAADDVHGVLLFK
jgi:hypothetical protein